MNLDRDTPVEDFVEGSEDNAKTPASQLGINPVSINPFGQLKWTEVIDTIADTAGCVLRLAW